MGKSSIAEALSKYYKLHHIKLKDVVSEAIAKLVNPFNHFITNFYILKRLFLSLNKEVTNSPWNPTKRFAILIGYCCWPQLRKPRVPQGFPQ